MLFIKQYDIGPHLGILVLHEKHGDWYFDASTEKKLYAVALQIVKKRYTNPESIYYIEQPEKPEEPSLGGLTVQQITALPDRDVVKQSAMSAIENHKEDIRSYNGDMREFQMAHDAVKNKDGKLAFAVLDGRNDCEYEGYEIIEMSDIADYSC